MISDLPSAGRLRGHLMIEVLVSLAIAALDLASARIERLQARTRAGVDPPAAGSETLEGFTVDWTITPYATDERLLRIEVTVDETRLVAIEAAAAALSGGLPPP